MHMITDCIDISLAYSLAKIITIGACGLPITYMLTRATSTYVTTHINQHSGFIASKLVYYGGITYVVLSILHELGFNITALLGAAGVIGVALGFASQTSMSNIVAGIFLLFEHAFKIGDEIAVDSVSGKVESIDLFSVKIRTTENTLVRIPHELLIKKEVTNLSFFAKRKLLFTIIVPYQTDMKHLVDEVRATFSQHPYVLTAPEIRVDEFFNDRCSLRIRPLVKNNEIVAVQEELLVTIKAKLIEKGFVIHELYIGSKPTSSDVLHVCITSANNTTS